MVYDPTAARYGDFVASSTETYIHLPSDDGDLMPWLNPDTDEWFDADDIHWTGLRLTHRLVPVDENEAG